MTDQIWQRFGRIEATLDRLQSDIEAAERDRNFGLARIIAAQIRAAETARDQMLARLDSVLPAAAA